MLLPRHQRILGVKTNPGFMPYETRVVDQGKGVHKTGIGVLTSAELLSSSVQRAIEESQKEEHLVRYALLDFTRTTEAQVSAETILKLAQLDRNNAQFSRGCFVASVAPDPLVFGLARQWSSYAKDLGWEAQVFHDRESAKEWLRTRLGNGDHTQCSAADYPSLQPGPASDQV